MVLIYLFTVDFWCPETRNSGSIKLSLLLGFGYGSVADWRRKFPDRSMATSNVKLSTNNCRLFKKRISTLSRQDEHQSSRDMASHPSKSEASRKR